jgi:hypothetical protein
MTDPIAQSAQNNPSTLFRGAPRSQLDDIATRPRGERNFHLLARGDEVLLQQMRVVGLVTETLAYPRMRDSL